MVLNPSNGQETQRYILSPADHDIVHHASSAKFSAKKPVAEDCGHKWSIIYKPVEIMLQYLPYGAHWVKWQKGLPNGVGLSIITFLIHCITNYLWNTFLCLHKHYALSETYDYLTCRKRANASHGKNLSFKSQAINFDVLTLLIGWRGRRWWVGRRRQVGRIEEESSENTNNKYLVTEWLIFYLMVSPQHHPKNKKSITSSKYLRTCIPVKTNHAASELVFWI